MNGLPQLFGLAHTAVSFGDCANQRRDLMEIVEDRYGRGSTLITSQLPLDKWHDVVGDPTFADAILDRIVTTPIGWNWTGRPCASSKPTNRQNPRLGHPQNKPPAAQAYRPSRQKETRNDRRAQLPVRPGGSTGTSRTRRCISHEGTPRRARVPPIDYRDGLSPCLTSKEETDITTIIQRRPQHPRRTGRDQSEQLVAIRRNEWSRSSECAETALDWAAGDRTTALNAGANKRPHPRDLSPRASRLRYRLHSTRWGLPNAHVEGRGRGQRRRSSSCLAFPASRTRELGMRVLLIEDDSATAQSIELMLKSEGFVQWRHDLDQCTKLKDVVARLPKAIRL